VGSVVLDASAALALLKGESGAEAVKRHIPGAVISAVNLAEVAGRLAAAGMKEGPIRAAVATLGLEIAPCEESRAIAIGLLYPATRQHGLSLGDRACLALAQERKLPAVTADRAWKSLAIDVEILLIRN